jgi:hypothetical protein
MMSDPIARARDDLARLEQKIAFHDAEREKAAKAAEEIRTFIRLSENYGMISTSHRSVPSKGAPASGPTKSERISQIAEELIRADNRRVGVSKILAVAEAEGVSIGSPTEAGRRNYISNILSRNPNFHGIRHRGWWLVSLGHCPDDPPEALGPQNTETADLDLGGADSAASAEPRPTSEGDPVRPVNPWSGGGT